MEELFELSNETKNSLVLKTNCVFENVFTVLKIMELAKTLPQ